MISELEEKRRQVNELMDEYKRPHATSNLWDEAMEKLQSMGWKPKQKKPVTAITDKNKY